MGKFRISLLLALGALGLAFLVGLLARDDDEFPTDDPIEIDV